MRNQQYFRELTGSNITTVFLGLRHYMNKIISKDPEYWNKCLSHMKYLLRHKSGWIILAIDNKIRMEYGKPDYYEYTDNGCYIRKTTPDRTFGNIINGQIYHNKVGNHIGVFDVPNISLCHYILLVGYPVVSHISNEYPVTPENAIRIIQSMPEREAFQEFWKSDLKFLYCSN